MRRAQTATATELKNLKNYLRTRGENLVRLSKSVDKESDSKPSLISAVQRAEPVMLRVSKKSLRAIPKERLEKRLVALAASQDLKKPIGVNGDEGEDRKENIVGQVGNRMGKAMLPDNLEKSASFGANTTKLIAQTGFVVL